MADRAILFSAPMVRALLHGRKTQTRRQFSSARVFATVERPAYTLRGEDMQRALQGASGFRNLGGDNWVWACDAYEWQAPIERTEVLAHIGYGIGDRLWVREAWRTHKAYDDLKPCEMSGEEAVWPELDRDNCDALGRYRHARFMPRWASRLTLTVTDVRIQRLQDCSEADAQAEGVELESADPPFYYVPGIWPHSLTGVGVEEPGGRHAVRSYAKLWDHINGSGAWEKNPWVVAVTFDVLKGNIDNLPQVAA